MGWLANIQCRGGRGWLGSVVFWTAVSAHPGWAGDGTFEDPLVFRAAEVSITTDQQMDFGQLADRDGSVSLGLADAITADPDLIHFGGSPYSGIYTLTGDPDTMVDISVTSFSGNGFSLGSFVSSEGNLPVVGATLDGTGSLVLTMGATLTLDASVAAVGPGQSVSFVITSTYN